MTLRCFLFSSDEGTAAILRQILSSLGIEAEVCPNAVTAAERITNQPFQVVIIDWDQQPEAGLLLNTSQERKAAERPLTLAMVSNDADAPRALHAGANSLLRKPIVPNQARDTLTTARDLLASKQGSSPAATPPVTQPAPPVTEFHASSEQSSTALRAGDFLQTPAMSPGENFETEASVPQLPEEFAVQAVRPVRDLEPMAAAVPERQDVADTASPTPSGTRGLEWYLRHKVATASSANSGTAAATAPTPAALNAAPDSPELLGYDQTPSHPNPATPSDHLRTGTIKPALKIESSVREQRKEAELFAYIQGEKPSESHQGASSSFQFAKRALVPALVLAAIAIVAAPQAPWHSWLRESWRKTGNTVHVWLNPQPQTPKQAPVAHETFTRAGDEYKLPVAEQIPDATTDPSQIQVVPVTDPTIKKANPEGGNAMDPSAVPVDRPASSNETSAENSAGETSNQPASANPDPFRPVSQTPAQPVTVIETPLASHSNTALAVTLSGVKPAPSQPPQPRVITPPGTIPPSLKSQLAPANPGVSSNKPLEAAAPAIEPVDVLENAERALIADNPAPVYPVNAKGQQGTVVLQVLIARDGTVQDAKFLQGSLLFARNAIDAVRQWKFKPYILNGRPVSVQTQLTLRFKAAQ